MPNDYQERARKAWITRHRRSANPTPMQAPETYHVVQAKPIARQYGSGRTPKPITEHTVVIGDLVLRIYLHATINSSFFAGLHKDGQMIVPAAVVSMLRKNLDNHEGAYSVASEDNSGRSFMTNIPGPADTFYNELLTDREYLKAVVGRILADIAKKKSSTRS